MKPIPKRNDWLRGKPGRAHGSFTLRLLTIACDACISEISDSEKNSWHCITHILVYDLIHTPASLALNVPQACKAIWWTKGQP